MKRFLTLFSFTIFLVKVCHAQLGITVGYKTLNPEGWREYLVSGSASNPYPTEGWQVGLDYHLFGAKRRRIEFTVELSYSHFQDLIRNTTHQSEIIKELVHRQFGFQFSTMIYVFDLNCDYKCDDIATIRSFFRKGFYLELDPTLVYAVNTQQKYRQNEKRVGQAFKGGITIGTGLDLECSNILTLTPIIRFYYFPDYSRWSDKSGQSHNIDSDLKQFFVGCRLQFDI